MYSTDNSAPSPVTRPGAGQTVVPLRRAVPGRSAVDALQQRGIDDLAKFRLVAFLCDHPTLWAPAEHFAAKLGFHSTSRTAGILDELVACGVVRRVGNGSASQNNLYGLAVTPAERATLAALCQQQPDTPGLRAYLARLADRSLARLRRERSRPTKRTREHGDVVTCGPEDFRPHR